MARPKKLNNTKIINCKQCHNDFEIPKFKNREFCSNQCAQSFKSTNRDWLNKRDVTNMQKYGVKSPLESILIKANYQKSIQQKYGANSPFASKEIMEKSKKTLISRYGSEVASKNPEVAKKISETLKGRKLPRENFIEIKLEKIINYCKETDLTPIFTKDELIEPLNNNRKFKFKCNKCSNIFEVSLGNSYLPTCAKCSNYRGYSIVEEEISNFIYENYDKEVQLKKKHLIPGSYEIDIYLPDAQLAIEVNGLYWHSEIWGKYQNYHLNKTEGCIRKNINLLHIWDHEWIYKKNIVKSILLNKLGKTPNKIYARKCKIKLVSPSDKNEFLNNNHIQGQCVSKTNIGLYYGDELVSIMTFGKYRFKDDGSEELIRFCNKLNTNVLGAASKLFTHYINNFNPTKIITFADRRYSTGNLYPILGFDFSCFTLPSYFYWKNMKLYSRITYQKHKQSAILNVFDKSKSEYENMVINGFNRVWDCGNYKFIWNKKAQLL